MTLAKYKVQKVDETADPILRNLFELYLHDMAEWFEFDTSKVRRYSFPSQLEVSDKGIDVYLIYSGDISMSLSPLHVYQ